MTTKDQDVIAAVPERTIVASGFATVDIVTDGVLRASPGGTALNVARALQSLGWSAGFVGTVGADPTGKFLKSQTAEAGVDVSELLLDPAWTTPVVVQEEHRGDHTWRFSCPVCRAPFAKHRPAPESLAIDIVERRARPDVFFFDRASLFTLALATAWSARGTYVVFEPAGLGRPQLFERATAVADLIKFSSQRGDAFRDRLRNNASLTFETMGSAGAQFRLPGRRAWHKLPANNVPEIVDTAGAGDWTTAAILDALISVSGDHTAPTQATARAALTAAQRLGALSCGWEGVHPGALREVDGGNFESFACPRVLAQTSTDNVKRY